MYYFKRIAVCCSAPEVG